MLICENESKNRKKIHVQDYQAYPRAHRANQRLDPQAPPSSSCLLPLDLVVEATIGGEGRTLQPDPPSPALHHGI